MLLRKARLPDHGHCCYKNERTYGVTHRENISQVHETPSVSALSIVPSISMTLLCAMAWRASRWSSIPFTRNQSSSFSRRFHCGAFTFLGSHFLFAVRQTWFGAGYEE